MNTKLPLLISFLLLTHFINSQNFSGIYKIDGLLDRVNKNDTFMVINFWATWCKPCVEELPTFDSLMHIKSNPPVKVLLVCLDFKEELEKKVKPFLKKHNIQADCVLLDEVNGNEFINKISPEWSGAIPATLFKHGGNKKLVEKKMKLAELLTHIKELQ